MLSHILWQKYQKEHQIHAMSLALGGKNIKIGRSMDNIPSLLYNKVDSKVNLSKLTYEVAIIDILTISRNILKILKNTINYEAFSHEVRRDSLTPLNILLGLNYDVYSEIMIELNLLKQQ